MTENQAAGGNGLTSVQTDWKIRRLMLKQNMSIREIKNNCGVDVSKNIIHRHITDSKNIVLKN